jgi:hypothetical protein
MALIGPDEDIPLGDVEHVVQPWVEPEELSTPYAHAVLDVYFLASDFGIELSPDAIKRLHVLFDAMYKIDDWVDGTSDPGLAIKEVLSSLDPWVDQVEVSHEEVNHALTSLVNVIGPERLGAFQEIVLCVFDVNKRLKKATDVDEFIELSQEEGETTADMILFVIADEVRDEFISFLRDMFKMVNLADDVKDLKMDNANGEKLIQPSWSFYKKTIPVLLDGGMSLARRFPDKSTLWVHALRILLNVLNKRVPRFMMPKLPSEKANQVQRVIDILLGER